METMVSIQISLGAEPADLLAAVEHQLQRADADGERDEAEPVEAQVLVAAASPP